MGLAPELGEVVKSASGHLNVGNSDNGQRGIRDICKVRGALVDFGGSGRFMEVWEARFGQ